MKDFRAHYENEAWLQALEAGFDVDTDEMSLVDAAHLYEVGARTRSVVGFPLIVKAFKVFFGEGYRRFLVSNLYRLDSRVLCAMVEVAENPGRPYSDLLDVVARRLLGV